MSYHITTCSHILLAFFILGILSVSGQNNGNTFERESIPMDSLVRYGRLKNGFTYYIYNNPQPKGKILFQMVTKAGTLHEDKNQLAYAHLIEHLGSTRTNNYPKLKEFFKMSGGDLRAYTSFLHTNYIGNLPLKNDSTLMACLQIMHDWAQGIQFLPQSIEVERGAIISEMTSTTPSNQWVHDTIMNMVGRHSGLKILSRDKRLLSIKNFNKKELLRFYKDWYRPDLQAAIIVGDVDVGKVESKVKELFSSIKPSRAPSNAKEIRDRNKIKLNGENHFVSIIDSIWNNFQLNIVSVRPNTSWKLKSTKEYENMLIEELISELLQPRINSTFLRYNPPFKNFSLNYHFMDRSVSLLKIEFDTNKTDKIKQKVQRALTLLKGIMSQITEEDLIKAKTTLLKRQIKKDTVSSSVLASRYRNHFVRGNAIPNKKYELKLIIEILNKITLPQINKTINDYLDLQRNTHFVFISPNQNVKTPDYSTFKSWLDQVKNVDTESNPKLENITSLKKIANISFKNDTLVRKSSKNLINVSTFNFHNNIKVLLKPDLPGDSIMTIRAYRSLPISIKNKKKYLAATVAGEVIQHSGVGKYNKFTLNNFKNSHGIYGLKLNFNRSEQNINGRCEEESLEELLSLLYLYMRNPRKDDLAFQNWKQQEEKKLHSYKTMNDLYSDIRNSSTPVLDKHNLGQLTIDNIYNVYNSYFSDINGYTFIITGNFNERKAASTFAKFLSAFPEDLKIKSNENHHFKPSLKKMNDTIYLNNTNKASVKLYLPVKVSTDLKTKITLSILKRALHNRIWERLRIGCYSPSAYGQFIDIQNGIYEFSIGFDSELGNQDKMIQYAKEEIRLLRDEGIDDQEFKMFRGAEKSDWENGIKGIIPEFWYKYLKESLSSSENLQTELLQYKTILEHFISVEDINYAAKKYLIQDSIQTFLILPKTFLVNDGD